MKKLTNPNYTDEPIAIIGMSCRFPKAANLATFWGLLAQGIDAITEVPVSRWDSQLLAAAENLEVNHVGLSRGGFLDQVDRFDPLFFGISPKEAVHIDPQQRLILELAWEALEDAGIPPDSLAGTPTGVYLGLMWMDYALLLHHGGSGKFTPHTVLGISHSSAANRVSYSLGLGGPSLAVETASSSSLVAVHLACESLRLGETTLALAGGVSLNLLPDNAVAVFRMGALSPDGRCYTFDSRANGYVRGEGGGIVVLKPLARALSDCDPIYCVIRSSVVNNDGIKSGYTSPSVTAQEALLRKAYERAAIPPSAVDYVELHGTGTALGDPIEAEALGRVLCAGRPAERPLAVGSVKTNIGHLEAAAGIAGLIKTALCIKQEKLPPSLHFAQRSVGISEELPLQVQATLGNWPKASRKATAGVSSFGLGGTNAHVVLEAGPQANRESASVVESSASLKGPFILPLSARSAEALLDLARAYQEFLSQARDESPYEIAYTASVRRSHHAYRLAVRGSSLAEWQAALDAYLKGEPSPSITVGPGPAAPQAKLAFIFSGLGSQWAGMARQLLADEPCFHSAFLNCEAAIREETGRSISHELVSGEIAQWLERPDKIQPVLFAIQVALTALWRSWGIIPNAVIGTSMGEAIAGHVCGALSLKDAVRIVCRRGPLMQRMSGKGAMAVLELEMEAAERVIRPYGNRLGIAASNGPRMTIISGALKAVEAVQAELDRDGIFCRRLKGANAASHSPQMEVLRDDLLAALAELQPRQPTLKMFSTVTAEELTIEPLDAHYWHQNMCRPVLLWPTVQRLQKAGYTLFLEVSPHPVVAQGLREGLSSAGAVYGTLVRERPDKQCMLDTLGALYARGQFVDWKNFYSTGSACVKLPLYPWQRERYWIAESPSNTSVEEKPSAARSLAELSSLAPFLYERKWIEKDAPPPRAGTSSKGVWLVFGHKGSLDAGIQAKLEEREEACVLVQPGERYERVGRDLYTLDPSQLHHYQQLLTDIRSDWGSYKGILHMWGLDSDAEGRSALLALNEGLRMGCTSAFHLATALSKDEARDLPGLWLFTRGAQSLKNEDAPISLSQTPLWGLGRWIAAEHPRISCRRIDLGREDDSTAADALVAQILYVDSEEEILLRHGRRYVARLAQGQVGSHGIRSQQSPSENGTYLIANGCGALGTTAVECLLELGAKHLVLLEKHATSSCQPALLEKLQTAGVKMLRRKVDLASENELAELLAELAAKMPPLRGIIFMAEEIGSHFNEPRAAGLFDAVASVAKEVWNLHSLTQELPLDFFLSCSSIVPLIGAKAPVGGAVANAFLDFFARYQRFLRKPAISIQLGPVIDPEAVNEAPESTKSWLNRGLQAFSQQEGKQLLKALLKMPRGELFAMKLNVRQWVEFHPHLAASPMWAELIRSQMRSGTDTVTKKESFVDVLVAAQPAERQALLERQLLAELSYVLHLDMQRIERQMPFAQLGMDSQMSLELRNRLESNLNIELSATLLLTYPTIETLSRYLLGRLGFAEAATEHEQGLQYKSVAPLSPTGTSTGTGTGTGTGGLGKLSELELLTRLKQEIAMAKKGGSR